jgi:hypothetical protein
MRRSRPDNPLPYIVAGGLALLVAVAGGAYMLDAQPHVTPKRTAAQHKRVIRSWLKDNLHDADYEEVEWFEPLKPEQVRIFISDDDADRSKKNDVLAWAKFPASNLTLVRLRYRARVLAGGKRLCDETFFIRGGKMLAYEDSEDVLLVDGVQSRLMIDY